MSTHASLSTSEMQVTSIRLETELKERLKDLAGEQGYQSLMREILWQYVEAQGSAANPKQPDPKNSRFLISAISCREEICSLTGAVIPANSKIWLSMSETGHTAPIMYEQFSE